MKRYSLCLPLFLLALGACKKDREIKVYTVPKAAEKSPEAANPHGKTLPPVDAGGDSEKADAHAGMAVLAAPTFADEAPGHWVKKPNTPMRIASYAIKGEGAAVADVSFSSLLSAPGSLGANLNRWRDQVGQAPMDDEQLKKSTESVSTVFGQAVVIDVAGLMEKADPNQDGRIIGAIVEKDGRAWFYKLRGNADVVGKEKANFLKWIQSLKPTEQVAAVAPSITQKDVLWQLPDGWTADYGAGQRFATIHLPVEGVELAVSYFAGDVGGDVANVTRWRGQVGLPPLAEEELMKSVAHLQAGTKNISMVDLSGSQRRLIAAWVRHGENTWFFKLSGTEAAVDSCKVSFTHFIESIRFNSPES